MTDNRRYQVVCTNGHITRGPWDSALSLCEDLAGGISSWRCACQNCGAKLANYDVLSEGPTESRQMTDTEIQNAFKGIFVMFEELLLAMECLDGYSIDTRVHLLKARALAEAVKNVAREHDAKVGK